MDARQPVNPTGSHPPCTAPLTPGGDYGKKELSPALSNRFTSIWVPAIEDGGELLAILESRLAGEWHSCWCLMKYTGGRPNQRP